MQALVKKWFRSCGGAGLCSEVIIYALDSFLPEFYIVSDGRQALIVISKILTIDLWKELYDGMRNHQTQLEKNVESIIKTTNVINLNEYSVFFFLSKTRL